MCSRYRMAFIAARMSVLRGRPPGRAGRIVGSSRAHSAFPQVARTVVAVPPVNSALLVIDVNWAFCGERPEPILESIKRSSESEWRSPMPTANSPNAAAASSANNRVPQRVSR